MLPVLTTLIMQGLMLVPQGIGTLLSRGVAGRLTDRIGARPVAACGFAIVALSAFSLLAVLLSLWLPGAQRDRDRREPAGASPVPAAAGSGKIDV